MVLKQTEYSQMSEMCSNCLRFHIEEQRLFANKKKLLLLNPRPLHAIHIIKFCLFEFENRELEEEEEEDGEKRKK